jgi:hypothetical protein
MDVSKTQLLIDLRVSLVHLDLITRGHLSPTPHVTNHVATSNMPTLAGVSLETKCPQGMLTQQAIVTYFLPYLALPIQLSHPIDQMVGTRVDQ